MKKDDVKTFCPTSRKDWRRWLMKNHQSERSVWLVCYKAASDKPSIPWSDLVDEALCFGWIDSVRKNIDAGSFKQFFSQRKPGGTWSKINKEKVDRLMEQGAIMPAGLASIETAKQNGAWSILDEVEELTIPKDLAKAFRANPGSKQFFTGLSKSVKKMMLQWIMFAKRPETREKRIQEIATLAAEKRKPKQF